MTISILIAKIIAIVCISIGVGSLTGDINLGKIIKDIKNSAGLKYLSGILSLIVGMFLITYYDFYEGGWAAFTVILGWMAVIKGVALIAFPKFLSYFDGWFEKNNKTWGIIYIVLGLIFAYFGFIF